jgi:hypothetical protein
VAGLATMQSLDRLLNLGKIVAHTASIAEGV